jgi:hypothetical protein
MKRVNIRIFAVILAVIALLQPLTASAASSFIGPLSVIGTVASTVPHNGDINPYGVAVIQRSVATLTQGNILVSNFNNKGNLQGTGTTIVQIRPNGKVGLFAQIRTKDLPGPCPGGIGLTTALVVLQSGWVIVGSLPTSDGSSATAQAGCLIVLNSSGKVVETISGGDINGPWDMTAVEGFNTATLFVTNVLNGTVANSPNTVNEGTVVRLVLGGTNTNKPFLMSSKVIGSEFAERTDVNALVIGPTGVAVGQDGNLYVADTLANRLARITDPFFRTDTAHTGETVLAGPAINGPLGLATAPNGDLIMVNGNDGNMVEVSPAGMQEAVKLVDTTGAGAGTLFGLAISFDRTGVYFVNDGDNTLRFLH